MALAVQGGCSTKFAGIPHCIAVVLVDPTSCPPCPRLHPMQASLSASLSLLWTQPPAEPSSRAPSAPGAVNDQGPCHWYAYTVTGATIYRDSSDRCRGGRGHRRGSSALRLYICCRGPASWQAAARLMSRRIVTWNGHANVPYTLLGSFWAVYLHGIQNAALRHRNGPSKAVLLESTACTTCSSHPGT